MESIEVPSTAACTLNAGSQGHWVRRAKTFMLEAFCFVLAISLYFYCWCNVRTGQTFMEI